jgi:nitrite reductase/ring-hydroxylating ferredoxin subunit
MTHGTLAGVIIRDLILGRPSPYADLYDPARRTVRAAGTYLGENANMVGQMVGNWVRGGEVGEAAEIACGHGAILREGLAPVAVYRDDGGALHAVSGVCTHLGCVVQWNAGEKSWDCPCHGSRFDVDGAILNGPARKPLASAEITEPPFSPEPPGSPRSPRSPGLRATADGRKPERFPTASS